MKKVGILYHPIIATAHALAKKLEQFLTARGVSVWVCSAWEGEEARALVNGTELVLSVGGDGTILRTAQAVVPDRVPITGINLGKLGFMTELGADEAISALPALLDGQGWIDERAMLEVGVAPDHEPKAARFYALNDVVIAHGAIARVIYVEASINGEPMTTYKADGVIVATATGSTGYSLAAGGPILHPQSEEFLLMPIMPHLSSAYTLVLPPTSVVELGVTTVHQATLSIDGQINLPLSSGTRITVKHSADKIRFLRVHPKTSFYSTVEQRLQGKRYAKTDRKG
ncbi:NAD(+)/NADH kinase [Chloroflexota bacterium]